jgi:tetratricopeptide (TPR) repeat protein
MKIVLFKIGRWFLTIGAVLVLVGGVGISRVYAETDDDPCAVANSYMKLGDLQSAAGEFIKVLRKNPEETCALEGLDRILQKRRDLVTTYIEMGDFEKARDLIYALLAAETVQPDVLNDYDKLQNGSSDDDESQDGDLSVAKEYRIAQALFDLGRPSLAYDQLLKAITANPEDYYKLPDAKKTQATATIEATIDPTTTKAPEESSQPNEDAQEQAVAETKQNPVPVEPDSGDDSGQSQSGAEKNEFQLKENLKGLIWFENAKDKGGIILAGIAYIIAACILLHILRSFIKSISRPRLDIGDFETGTKIDCQPEIGFKYLLEREIQRLPEQKGISIGKIIDKVSDDIDLSGTTIQGVNEVNSIYKILIKLFPANVVTLDGSLHHSPTKGAGVTLRLVNCRNGIIDEANLWQSCYDVEFEPAREINTDCFYSLAEPAAMWTAWYMVNNFNDLADYKFILCCRKLGAFIRGLFKKQKPDKQVKTFGSHNMDSFLLCYLGTRYLESGRNPERARSLLLNSIDYDPENAQAFYNLAIADIRAAIRNAGDKNSLISNFAVPVNDLNHLVELSTPGSKQKYFILEEMPLQKLGVQKRKAGKSVLKDADLDLISVMAQYQLGAIGDYIYVLSGYDEKFLPALKEGMDHFEQSQELLETILHMEGDQKIRSQLGDYLEMIKIARKGIEKLVQYNPAKDPEIGKIEGDYLSMGSAYMYNLVCYYASMAGKLRASQPVKMSRKAETIFNQAMKEAEKWMDMACPEAGIREGWAAMDPDLLPLRDWLRKNGLKAKMLYRSKSIGEIWNIGQVYEKKLKTLAGLNTSDDFFTACATTAGRKYISTESKVPEELLYQWAKQCDLMRLSWIDGRFARLLVQAGVDSLKELKNRKAPNLLNAIRKANHEFPLVDYLPAESSLAEWIAAAGSTPLIFEAEKPKQPGGKEKEKGTSAAQKG